MCFGLVWVCASLLRQRSWVWLMRFLCYRCVVVHDGHVGFLGGDGGGDWYISCHFRRFVGCSNWRVGWLSDVTVIFIHGFSHGGAYCVWWDSLFCFLLGWAVAGRGFSSLVSFYYWANRHFLLGIGISSQLIAMLGTWSLLSLVRSGHARSAAKFPCGFPWRDILWVWRRWGLLFCFHLIYLISFKIMRVFCFYYYIWVILSIISALCSLVSSLGFVGRSLLGCVPPVLPLSLLLFLSFFFGGGAS